MGFAVPRRLSIQISQWFMPQEYTELKFLEAADKEDCQVQGAPCHLIPYLLAYADADNEGAHRVLLRVMADADPRNGHRPWAPAPLAGATLLPPALRRRPAAEADKGRASGRRRPASGSIGDPATKRRQPSPVPPVRHEWQPSCKRW